jgi:hypothetical protein
MRTAMLNDTNVIEAEVEEQLSPVAQVPSPASVLFNPEQFAAHFLYILDKQKKLHLFHYNAAQKDFMKNRTGRDLILKARQIGFSTMVQGEIFRRAVTETTTAIVMSHDDATTQKLRRIQERFYNHCKLPGDIQPARKYSNATLVSYPEFDSTVTIATAGSKDVGRGDTYSMFHGSEVAFWSDAESIMAGALQGGNPDVILESTPNGASGWFYDRCMEAMSGSKVWKLHFYPWFWDPTYRIKLEEGEILDFDDEELYLIEKYLLTPEQIKWRRTKKRELKRLFIQEYPEDFESCFLVSGDSYFGNVSNSFNAPLNAKYNPLHKYAAGLDWGKENDFTDLFIIDCTDRKQVALLHVNKLPWGVIRQRVASICKLWHIRTVVAESNSIGSVNIEELKKLDIAVHSFNTSNVSKADIMSDLYNALHEENLQLLPIPEEKHQFESFVSTKLLSGAWRIAAAGKGHDDIVISGGLAWFARKYARIQIWP